MGVGGQPLDEEDLVQYIITGLDEDFSPIVSARCTKTVPMTVGSCTLNSSTMKPYLTFTATPVKGGLPFVTNCGRGIGRHDGGNNSGSSDRGTSQGHGGGQGRIRGHGTRGPDKRPTCQVCFKREHIAIDCWYRFDEDYVADEKLAASATNSYGVDTNWYIDTCGTDHITGVLEKLNTKEKYNSGEQIHTASDAGIDISHIGHTTVHTPSHNIHLNNVLYVPQAKKNLISASQLAADNSAFLELHFKLFSLKDQVTKDILVKGRCRHGLCLITKSFGRSSNKQALGAVKLSLSRWHNCLGRSFLPIVKQVTSKKNLQCLDE